MEADAYQAGSLQGWNRKGQRGRKAACAMSAVGKERSQDARAGQAYGGSDEEFELDSKAEGMPWRV